MSRSYFVTGTDTEIGKTLVTAALVYKLNVLNPGSACAFKPVVAGSYRNSEGMLCNEDLETYKLVQDRAIPQGTICPYVLDTPAAPHLIAAEHGKHLELDRMVQAYQTLQAQITHAIAEGAGGFLTPVDDRHDLSTFAVRIAYKKATAAEIEKFSLGSGAFLDRVVEHQKDQMRSEEGYRGLEPV